jgi:hypothetical protein
MLKITFIWYAQSRKIGKPNNLKLFSSKETNGHKHDSQNLLTSPMPDVTGKHIPFR